MPSNVCMKCAYLFNKEQSIEECVFDGTNDAYFFCSQLKYYMASSLCHSLQGSGLTINNGLYVQECDATIV